jgi:hypothetical protein
MINTEQQYVVGEKLFTNKTDAVLYANQTLAAVRMMRNSIGPHYSVGENVFINKIDAILYANQTLATVNWHFHEDKFSTVDWTVEPEESLDYWYKLRAQEIRDTYDYVVILCSGGADSTNVVKTFLNNNIKIDEIIAAAPMEGLRDYSFNDKDPSHSNTISETIYAQIPLIKEISSQHPEVKITLHDYFQDMLDYDTDEWLYRCDDWIHPSSAARYRYERVTHLRNLAEAGKRIAFVYGIDKPSLIVGESDDVYIIFSDVAVNVKRPPFDREYPNVDTVMFYWTPTVPELLIKQAHSVAKWIYKPENSTALKYLNYYKTAKRMTFEERRYNNSKYERAIVPCIYPTTSKKIFQAEKPSKLFLGEHDDWFYQLHNKTRTFEMILSDTNNFYKNIDSKYLNSAGNGFNIFGNYYKIGKVNDFNKRHINEK